MFTIASARSSLLIVATSLVLGACSTSPSKGPSVPAGLESFYAQKLAFGACKGYATTLADAETFANDAFQCARLEVPLDCERWCRERRNW